MSNIIRALAALASTLTAQAHAQGAGCSAPLVISGTETSPL